MFRLQSYDVHVGLASTRTMEYIDLRGAPWTIALTSEGVGEPESAKATSVVYKDAIGSDSLEGGITKVDNYVKTHQRISLESSDYTHYSQTPFRDSNDDEWAVRWITKGGKAIGYFGMQWTNWVGPAISKDALKKMVEKYLARRESEAAIISRESVSSFAEEVDPNRPMEPPPGIDKVSAPGAEVETSMYRKGVVVLAVAGLCAFLFYKVIGSKP